MTAPTVKLNDGNHMPSIGLGTYPMDDEAAFDAVLSAVDAGYRLFDTAARYGNEAGVGRAVVASGLDRSELFVTTKLPGSDHGYETTLASFEDARRRLGLEYVDLYLIHWPLPAVNRYVDSFKAMIKLRDDGLVASIGVSNFNEAHLRRLWEETGTAPAVNQIELHPGFHQADVRNANAAGDIVTQAWSPLGRGTDILTHPAVRGIAADHSVTPAQVVLRWEIQLGVVPIPKSGDPGRQRANIDVFGFDLNDEQMRVLTCMDTGRVGGDPDVHEEF
ncbi:MAG TPA: aldo/keto reductase [Candidatus Stackebrandtia excrementipullorum]|nr:aldo/keto reductase [Candidatus Stackebrandtia excrementipullorum]